MCQAETFSEHMLILIIIQCTWNYLLRSWQKHVEFFCFFFTKVKFRACRLSFPHPSLICLKQLVQCSAVKSKSRMLFKRLLVPADPLKLSPQATCALTSVKWPRPISAGTISTKLSCGIGSFCKATCKMPVCSHCPRNKIPCFSQFFTLILVHDNAYCTWGI